MFTSGARFFSPYAYAPGSEPVPLSFVKSKGRTHGVIGWTTALISPRAVSVQVVGRVSLIRRTRAAVIDMLLVDFRYSSLNRAACGSGFGLRPRTRFVRADNQFSQADISSVLLSW